jgi:hypothetical protein
MNSGRHVMRLCESYMLQHEPECNIAMPRHAVVFPSESYTKTIVNRMYNTPADFPVRIMRNQLKTQSLFYTIISSRR